MGQSERGSYIVTVLSRIPADPPQVQTTLPHPGFDTPPPEVPFERRVTHTLATALVRLHRAATSVANGGDIDAFEASIEYGVSADLCESVALVRECASVAELGVSIGLALARPVKDVPSLAGVVFPHHLIEVIADAGRVLRDREPVEDFELKGPVIQVTRPEETMHGKATMYGLVEGSQRKVVVELWGDDWRKATRAMEEREHLRLHCVGKLERAGRSFVLNNPRDVQLLDDEA